MGRWILRVVAALALLALPAAAQAPRRVALVIGNAAYAHAGLLANPARDARLVANALAQAGFQTVDARSDLDVQAFGRALRDFRQKASGAQVALVYYAGHGIEGNGKNWLIPTDATLQSEYDLTYEAISLDQVMDALAGADLRVVILDACRDNPLGRSWSRGTRAVTRGLAPVEADDVLVIYAAAPGQTAADGQGAVNSPFATALASRLPEPGLAIQLLGGRVRDDVLRATGSVQRPFVSASITGEPFYLVTGSGSARAQPSAAESGSAIEMSVWESAQAVNNIGAYTEYLRQFPEGRFAAFARQKILSLQAPPSPSVGVAQMIGRWNYVGRCPGWLRQVQIESISETDVVLSLPNNADRATFSKRITARTDKSIRFTLSWDTLVEIVDANRLRLTQYGLGLSSQCDYTRAP
jgi:hypothetical protein